MDEGGMNQARYKLIVLFLVVAAVLCLASSAAGTSGEASGRSVTAIQSGLGREEPILRTRMTSSNSVVLQEGSFKNRRWQAIAFRPKHAKHGPVICLEIVVRRQRPGHVESLQSGGSECGRISEQFPKPVLTQFNLAGASLLAVAAPPSVQEIEFAVSPGSSFAKQLRSLNTRQRNKLRLAGLGFTAFRVQPAVCVKQLIGLAKDGTHLFETPA